MEYKIVAEYTLYTLELAVSLYTKEGWTPTGGVVVDGTAYLQAMTKAPKKAPAKKNPLYEDFRNGGYR